MPAPFQLSALRGRTPPDRLLFRRFGCGATTTPPFGGNHHAIGIQAANRPPATAVDYLGTFLIYRELDGRAGYSVHFGPIGLPERAPCRGAGRHWQRHEAVLPHLLSGDTPAQLVWPTRHPRSTYGAALVDEILGVQPDAIIWDTDANGRPGLVALTCQAYVESARKRLPASGSREDMLTAARRTLTKIAANSPVAVATCKATINAARGKTVQTGLDIELAAFRHAFTTSDMREGTEAFLAKRTPVFHQA